MVRCDKNKQKAQNIRCGKEQVKWFGDSNSELVT